VTDSGPDGAGKTILVVDDEVLIRMMVVDALLDDGFLCEEASSADEALAALNRDQQIVMMISDIGLSGQQDGHWLASQARSARPDLAIMLMSGYSDAGAASNNAFPVLAKPFEISELISQVRAHLLEDND
jgi:DNA-binding NtrC family response regulator